MKHIWYYKYIHSSMKQIFYDIHSSIKHIMQDSIFKKQNYFMFIHNILSDFCHILKQSFGGSPPI